MSYNQEILKKVMGLPEDENVIEVIKGSKQYPEGLYKVGSKTSIPFKRLAHKAAILLIQKNKAEIIKGVK